MELQSLSKSRCNKLKHYSTSSEAQKKIR